jgi:hypothetical protein
MTDFAELPGVIDAFVGRVNMQPRLTTLLKNWEPDFLVQVRDADSGFRFVFRNGRVEGIVPTRDEPGDRSLLLRGDAATLRAMFSGELNPLRAHSDGKIEIYGSEKDQIKLDTIVLIVWGA